MDIREIETEIDRLERADTTYTNCDKLATLYTIRNEYNNASAPKDNKKQSKSNYSYAAASSEFIDAFLNADEQQALLILDEHMECIHTLYPKEYNAIIRKLKNIFV